MKRFTWVGFGVALALTGASSVADAAYASKCLVPPTDAQCLDPAYHQSYCFQQYRSRCATVENAAYKTNWEGSTTSATSRLKPYAMNPYGMTYAPTKATSIWSPGGDSTSSNGAYASFMHAVRYGLHPTVWWVDPRTLWSANGNATQSCQEYVYEKFYSTSQFQDQLPAWPGDPDTAMQVFGYFSGYNGYGYSISRDGTIRTPNWPASTMGPKNAFAVPFTVGKFFSNTSSTSGWWYAVNRQAPTWSFGDAFGTGTYQGLWNLATFGADRYKLVESFEQDFLANVETRDALYHRGETCLANAWGPHDPWCDTDFPTIDDKLSALDTKIATILQTASNYGCIDSSRTYCDMPPRRVMDTLLGYVRSLEETAYTRCMLYTQGDFVNGKNVVSFRNKGGALVLPSAPTPGQLDAWMAAVDAWLKQFNFPVDPVTGVQYVGGAAGDSFSYGDSHFGVTFGYDASWKLDNYTAAEGKQYCNAQLHAGGRAYANARLIGSTFPLVDAHANLDVLDGSLATSQEFRLLGNVMYSQTDTNSTALVLDESASQTFASGSVIVPVFGIPVTISAGLAGGVGYQGRLSGGATARDCAGQVGLGITGSFKPYVELDAYASVSVDVGIFALGVKGNLTLLNVGLPLSVDLGVNGTGQDVFLTSSTRLDLDVRALDGHIVGFADYPYPLEDSEFDIVSWDGIHKTLNLFSSQISDPLRLSIAAIVTSNGLGAVQ